MKNRRIILWMSIALAVVVFAHLMLSYRGGVGTAIASRVHLLEERSSAILRLAVAPVVIGQGRRLLPQPMADAGLRLVSHEATPTGLLVLEYETTGAAPEGSNESLPYLE